MESTFLRKRPAWQSFAGRFGRLFGIQFYDLYYCEKPLSQPFEPVIPSLPIQVRLATNKDLSRIINRLGEDTRKVFDYNTSIDSSCYVAVHGDMITGYIWANRQFIDMVGMQVAKLPAGHSFSHNAYVFPEYRHKQIYRYLRQVICSEMYKSGFLSIACFVDKANTGPLKVFEREGMKFHNAPVLKLPLIRPIHFCRAFK